MNDLKNSIEKYFEACENVKKRRETWNEQTKTSIKKTLEEIKETYKLDAQVQSFSSGKNIGAVNLSLNNQHSGIVQENEKSMKAFVKDPGYLVFTQSYNGLIHVIVSLPSIDGIVEKQSGVLLATIEPSECTIDVINKYVVDFFEKITTWERGTE